MSKLCANEWGHCRRLDKYVTSDRHLINIQQGQGFFDSVSNLFSKGKAIASKAQDVAFGNIGTTISNLVPDSDSNARPLYPHEQHTMLKLPNGKYGRANYMGPGTQLVKRLKRGDPPRTASDKEAQSHDIRYSLATNYNDVRAADNKMISVMKRLIANKLDDSFNTTQGLKLIQAKTKLEDLGLPKDSFATFGGIDPADKPLVQSKLNELEKEGFGKKSPSHRLKKKLLTNLKRQKKGSGKSRVTYSDQAIHNQQGEGKVADFIFDAIKRLIKKGHANYMEDISRRSRAK